jgi:hypothetical protein
MTARGYGPHFAQGGCDRFEHAVGIRKHVVVPETRDTVTLVDEPTLTYRVALIGRMLAAIDFDDQPQLATDEVDDITSDRILTDELFAFDLTGTQAVPQPLLSIGGVAAQSARNASSFRVWATHSVYS